MRRYDDQSGGLGRGMQRSQEGRCPTCGGRMGEGFESTGSQGSRSSDPYEDAQYGYHQRDEREGYERSYRGPGFSQRPESWQTPGGYERQSYGASGGSSTQGNEPWGRGSSRSGPSTMPRNRGPKGYKRSDERLKEDISDRLMSGHLDASDVEVDVKSGVVTISGTVDNRSAKYQIEELADNIPGVTDVVNHLRIKREDSTTPMVKPSGPVGDTKSGDQSSGDASSGTYGNAKRRTSS